MAVRRTQRFTPASGAGGVTIVGPASLASEKTLTLPTSDLDLGTLGNSAGKGMNYYKLVGSSPATRTYPGSYPMGGTAVSLTVTADRLIAVPFLAQRGGTLDNMYAHITTAVGGQNIRLGIYDNVSDTVIQPNARLFDSGNISSASTGIKTAAISSLVLTTGSLYWLAFNGSNAGIVVVGWAGADCWPIGGFNNTDLSASDRGIGFFATATFGSNPMPDPFPSSPSTYGSTTNSPLITVHFSA